MSVPAICPYNQADACTLSGGAWAAGSPLTNLQTRDLGEYARSILSNRQAWLKASSCTRPARFMGFINHNLAGLDAEIPPALPWRLRTIHNPGGAVTFNPRSKAVAILASTNLSGAVAAVQDADPYAPDSTWLTAVSGTANTEARFSMQGADCALMEGVGIQLVRIAVRKTSGASNPTCRIEIWENGTLRVTGSNLAVTSGTLFLQELTWDAADFVGSPPDPDLVQVKIVGTASATSTVEIGAVEWLAEYVSSGNTVVRDTSFNNYEVPENYWGPPRMLENLYLIHDWAENIDVDEVFFEIDATNNITDDYWQAGRLVIAEGIEILDPNGDATGQDIEWTYGWGGDPSLKVRTRSGGLRTSRRKKWHRTVLPFSYVQKSFALTKIIQRMDAAGTTEDCLVYLEDGLYLWGTQEELGELQNQATQAPSMSRTFVYEETV